MKTLIKAISLSALVLSSVTMAKELTGKELSENRKLGNCLACHMIPGGMLTGTIAPPLVAMKARFSKTDLRAQIFDARINNEHSMMPPFGAHLILSPKQVDKVTDYIYSL